MADEFTFELNNPLTEEEWDLITDVDLDNTPSMMFHTKHGKDVEYVKVKHGRWVAENSRPRSMIFYCSECKQIAYDAQGARGVPKRCRYHYCPNCGARMDEVEE